MKTIYFHVGTPKTGTTTLQEFCIANKQLLENEGLYYPINPAFLNKRSANGFLLASQQKNQASRSACWDKYLQDILNTSAKNILISEEIFFLLPSVDWFKELTSLEYNVKFIFYIRPSFGYLCSFWSEMRRVHEKGMPYVKYPVSLENFLLSDDRYLNDLEKVTQLANEFGDESIILRAFEKESFTEKDLVTDFLNIFNIAPPKEAIMVPLQNSNARSRKMLDAINILQTANVSESFLHATSITLEDPKDVEIDYEYLLGAIGGDVGVQESVSDDIIEKVVLKYSRIEDELAKRFLGKDKLFFNEFPKFYNQNRPVYEGLSNEDLLKINIFVQNKIYSMRPSYQKLWEKIERKLFK